MNINQIIDWILKNPIAYPGKHNYTQPRTIETYMPLKPKDQFLLIIASLKEYINDSYLNGKSLNIPKFGAFTFQIMGPTTKPIQHQKKLQVEKLPASYKVIRPCFVVDACLRQHINQNFKTELDKSDSLYTFYQQGQGAIFCNSQILANISYVDKLTADAIINIFVQAITDLTKLGYDLDMDFGLCKINLKSKTLTYKFTQQLIDVVNEAEYCKNFLKQSNTSNCWAPYQQENKQMNEKFFAPWSPQSLVATRKTEQLKRIKDFTSIEQQISQ